MPSRIEYMCTIHAYMFRCVATSGLFVKFLKFLTIEVTAFTSLCEGLRTHEGVPDEWNKSSKEVQNNVNAKALTFREVE